MLLTSPEIMSSLCLGGSLCWLGAFSAFSALRVIDSIPSTMPIRLPASALLLRSPRSSRP